MTSAPWAPDSSGRDPGEYRLGLVARVVFFAWGACIALVSLLVALALLFTPQGGGLSPIAEAAQRTVQAVGVRARFSGTLTVQPANGKNVRVPLQGRGLINGQWQEARFAMTIGLPPPSGQTSLDEAYYHGSLYLRSPLLAPDLPPGAQWLHTCLGRQELRDQEASPSMFGSTGRGSSGGSWS